MFFINLIENKQERELKAQLLAAKLEQGQKQSPSCLQTLVNFVWATNLAYYAFETESELEAYYWETMQDLNDMLMGLLNDDFYKVKWLQGIARTYQLVDHLLMAVRTYQKAIAYEEEKFVNSAQQPITQSLHDLLVEFAELRLKQAKLSQKEPELARQYFEIAQQTASRALIYTQSQEKAKLYYVITQTHYYLAKEKRALDTQAAIKGFFSAINAAVAGYKSSKINKPAYLQAIQMCHKMLSPLLNVLIDKENNPISKPLTQPQPSKYALGAIHALDELIDKIKQNNSASLDLTNDLEQCSKQIRKYITFTKGNPASFWKADIAVSQSINNNTMSISKLKVCNEM